MHVQSFAYGFTQSINDVMQVAYAAERIGKPYALQAIDKALDVYAFLTCDEAFKFYGRTARVIYRAVYVAALYTYVAGRIARRLADNYVAQCEATEPDYSDVWEYPGYVVVEDEEVCFPSYENTPAPQDELEPVDEFLVIQSGAIALDIPSIPTIKAMANLYGVKGCNGWRETRAHQWYREVTA